MQLVTNKFSGKPVIQASRGVQSWIKKSFSAFRFMLPVGIVAAFTVLLSILVPRVSAANETLDLTFLWDLVDTATAGIPHVDAFITAGLPLGVKIVVLVFIISIAAAAGAWIHKKL